MARRALIIEDDFLIAMEIEDILLDMGFDVVGAAATEEDAVRLALEGRPDLMLVDYRLARGNGVDAVRAIERHMSAAILFVTGSADEVLRLRPDALCIGKPFDPERLMAAIHRALGQERPEGS
jgi:DNA-binding response OmpR family regulator